MKPQVQKINELISQTEPNAQIVVSEVAKVGHNCSTLTNMAMGMSMANEIAHKHSTHQSQIIQILMNTIIAWGQDNSNSRDGRIQGALELAKEFEQMAIDAGATSYDDFIGLPLI